MLIEDLGIEILGLHGSVKGGGVVGVEFSKAANYSITEGSLSVGDGSTGVIVRGHHNQIRVRARLATVEPHRGPDR